jgi:hypothetical protein
MNAENVIPLMQPDADAMLRHLEHLFGGFLDGCHDGLIELAWTSAQDGKLKHAELHPTDDLEAIAARAAEFNAIPGTNVYIGAALRKPGTPPFGRGQKNDYYASTAFFVDIDDEGAAEAVAGKYRGCKPTLAVVTGRHPHKRVQLWWRLETPERDPIAHESQCRGLLHVLGGDKAVWNCDRVMRLGGSIAWPSKDGRVIEKTEVHAFDDGRPLAMMPGQLAKAYPPIVIDEWQQIEAASVAPPAGVQGALAPSPLRSPITGRLSPSALIAAMQRGDQWHNNMIRLVAHLVGRGLSDVEILAMAAGLTMQGYTERQTVAEMQAAIRGARAKWAKPSVEHEFDPETGEIIAPFVPDDDEGPILASSLLGRAPEREWLVDQWLPSRTTTALYGDGGMNKTLLALQLAHAHATGGDWLGHQVPKGRALCIFCEDDQDEIHRRLDSIDQASGTVLRSQVTDLALWPRTGKDTVLQTFSRDNVGALTAFHQRLDRVMDEMRPTLLVLDTAADMFGGNENIRGQVNQFIKFGLGCFILKYQTTILLLAHPSLSGLSSGTGTGGSTAWNNSVRSRWYLEPVKEQPDRRTLTRKKSNYAAAGDDQKIDLVWHEGVLKVAGGTVETVGSSQAIEILKGVEQAFKEGNPFGAHEQSVRPLITWMTMTHGLKRDEARRWIMSWLANAVLVEKRAGRNTSRKGLSVVNWPGPAGEI